MECSNASVFEQARTPRQHAQHQGHRIRQARGLCKRRNPPTRHVKEMIQKNQQLASMLRRNIKHTPAKLSRIERQVVAHRQFVSDRVQPDEIGGMLHKG
jgi:hypothetical protein